VPFYFDKAHYTVIAHLLKTGDVEASTFSNPATSGVKVSLENGSIITWSNSEHNHWACTVAGPEGLYRGSTITRLAMDAPAEDVARFIGTFDYDSVIEEKTVEQERALREEPIAEVEAPVEEEV
jgi:hypothetical protein